MNYQEKVLLDRKAQLEGVNSSNLGDGIKEGIRLRLKAKESMDDRRMRKIAATEGMRRHNTYSAGEQFNSDIHQAIDGVPVQNKDGSFRLKPGRKKVA